MAQKRSGPMTAAELQAELANDPKYQAMLREKEAKRAAAEAIIQKEEASLVRELQEVGFNVILSRIPGEEYEGPPRSVWDLVNTNSRYPEAIPILVKHMQLPYGRDVKEGIIRALCVPEARGVAAAVLIDEFAKTEAAYEGDEHFQLKWVLGMAIAETATPETVSLVVELVCDKRHGKTRAWLPLALRCLSKSDAESLLETLTNDIDVREYAIETLDRIRKKKQRQERN